MNIGSQKKQAIKALYLKGESIENLALVTGFSKSTIQSVVNTSNNNIISKKSLLRSWDAVVVRVAKN